MLTNISIVIAVLITLLVLFKVGMHLWTLRLMRAYAFLTRIQHAKSWGQEVTPEHVASANQYAREYPYSRLPINFGAGYVDTVLDDFGGSRRAFSAYAKTQGYRK